MPATHRPRKGSLQFWPRKRAKRIYPRIRSWPKSDEVRLLGFAGYKAGMTHVIAIDNVPYSPTKGEEVFIPVTVIETPPLKVFGIRAYTKDMNGLKTYKEVWTINLSNDLARKINLPKKYDEKEMNKRLEEIEKAIEEGKIVDVRVLVHTLPRLAGISKKKPEIFEIAIGGDDVKKKFEYAKSILGKEVSVKDVFKEYEFIDVCAVTKGHGYTGGIKRFGLKLRHHKSKKGRRKSWSKGPEGFDRVLFTVPMPGQYGFFTRTEYNKMILKISNPSEFNITPKGGFLHYGVVKSDYILVKGSVPGPVKRLIRLRKAIRPPKKDYGETPYTIVYISTSSKQGK